MAVAGLTGTGLIADDLYLLAHHDVTGRPFLQPRALRVGLAAALLSELAIDDMIRVRAGQIAVTAVAPPGGELSRHVLRLLLAEPGHDVGDWLAYLGPAAGELVARRLAAAGYLTRTPSRRPWRPPRWIPLDPDCAFAPHARAGAVLDPSRPAAGRDVVVAGLAAACGLGSRLAPFGPPGARGHLDTAVRRLSPSLRELVAQTQAAVDGALLSHRM
jgi:hypothetical protein